jgi:hypothetical protein
MTDHTALVAKLRKLKWLIHDDMRGLVVDTSAHEAADAIEALTSGLAEVDKALKATAEAAAYHCKAAMDAKTELTATKARLAEAVEDLHDAINRPKGVVPASAEPFYIAAKCDVLANQEPKP